MRGTIANRAAQWAPFAALDGYQELVDKAVEAPEPRRVFTEEEAERLSAELAVLERGDKVLIERYDTGRYVTEPGVVREVDAVARCLRLEGRQIAFGNLWHVELDLQ